MFTLLGMRETGPKRRTVISRGSSSEKKLLKRSGWRRFGIIKGELQLEVANMQFVGGFQSLGNAAEIMSFVTVERPPLRRTEVMAGGHVSQECLHSMSQVVWNAFR